MKHLKHRQIAEKTDEIRQQKTLFLGVQSWVRYIRDGLGMTLEQLSRRTELSTSTLGQLEKNESMGKVTLGSLKKIGEAMNCQLIYALVPNENLEAMRDRQALKKAQQLLEESNLQMEYEDQAVNQKKLKEQLLELKEQLKSSRTLWDE